MRSGKTIAALALLPALLTGCGPKEPKGAAVQTSVQAPSLPPSRMVALLPSVPSIPPTPRPVLKLDTTAPPEPKPETASSEQHHTPKHHAKPTQEEASKPSGQSAGPSASQNNQVASAQPAEMSPIGQISTANENANTADRHQISDQIDATENGLNAIKRSFTPDEQKTVVQIRTFITRARDALKADDLDGARTLSTKAHLLLLELTQQ
jgi:hypothetical protein